MNRTTIEWCLNPDGSPGYTWNPITGCLNGCPYCYARKLANGRLKRLYISYQGDKTPLLANYNELPLDKAEQVETDPFYPRFWEERLAELQRGIDDADYQSYIRQKGRGIFVCDMGDLFGIGVPEQWTRRILEVIGDDCNAMHRLYLLTKQAQRLPEFSPFPENVYLGVTATNQRGFLDAIYTLVHIKATIRYISFEPLLGEIPMTPEQLQASCDWLIIGACTGNMVDMAWLGGKYPELAITKWNKKWVALPRIEWIQEIVEAADKAGIPVFLKENLVPLIAGKGTPEGLFYKDIWLRQELPIEQ
ncbi:hypothetical protein ES707_01319 [subsurface metagenome]